MTNDDFYSLELSWPGAKGVITAFRAEVLESQARWSRGTSLDDDGVDHLPGTRHLCTFEGDDQLVAAVRLHKVASSSSIAPPELALVDKDIKVIGMSRFVVAPEHRHSYLTQHMFNAIYQRARSLGAQVLVTAVPPELVMSYEALGFFRYGPGFTVVSGDSQRFRVPLMLNLHDVAYMRRMGSALTVLAQSYLNLNDHGERLLASLGDITRETRPPRRSALARPLMTDEQPVEGGPTATLHNWLVDTPIGDALRQCLAAGVDVVRTGSGDPSLYLLVSGTMGVVPSECTQPVMYLQQGDIVGEASLLSGRTQDASIRTLSECEVLRISDADVSAVIADNPEMGARLLVNIARAFAERFGATTRTMIGDKPQRSEARPATRRASLMLPVAGSVVVGPKTERAQAVADAHGIPHVS